MEGDPGDIAGMGWGGSAGGPCTSGLSVAVPRGSGYSHQSRTEALPLGRSVVFIISEM